MAMSREEKMRYFNEFLFARMFRQINEEKFRRNDPVMMVSEGRALRKKAIELAYAKSRAQEAEDRNSDKPDERKYVALGEGMGTTSFGNASTKSMIEALNEVFGPEYTIDENQYNSIVRDFSNYTGFASNRGQNGDVRSAGRMPLSPFDSRFEYRQTFRGLGSKMGFCDMSDLDKLDGDAMISSETSDGFRREGLARTDADKSGLTMLQRYMSKSEFQKCAPWLTALDESEYMDERMFERTCAILDFLDNRGISYEIQPDTNPGQLKAVCGSKDMSIRITDAKSNQQYIGRVYQAGRAMYLTTNKSVPTPGKKNSYNRVPYSNPTTRDVQSVVAFALGIPGYRTDAPRTIVDRSTGKYVMNPNRRLIGQSSLRNGANNRGDRWNEAYISKTCSFGAVVGALPHSPEYGDVKDYDKVMIQLDAPRSESRVYIGQANRDPETFLANSVASARTEFARSFDVDMLVDAFNNQTEPVFSQDENVALIQRRYWDVLLGREDQLEKPDGEDGFVYTGTPEEKVRAHLADSVNYYVGNYELDENGHHVYGKFNPMVVARYMVSGRGEFANSNELTAAARDLNMQPDDFIDSGNNSTSLWRDRLVYFDKSNAYPLNKIDNPVAKEAFKAIWATLTINGAKMKQDDILIDNQGIVHFSGMRSVGQKQNDSPDVSFEGEIGQIFLPEADGLVRTQFASSDNYYTAPAYRAHILPQKPGENLSMEERTRLHGYTQELVDQIRQDLSMAMRSSIDNVGSPTDLNKTYRNLYDTRFSLDFRERAKEERMDPQLLEDIIETATRRVQYGDEIKEGSTIHADYMYSSNDGLLNDNDNFKDPFILTGRRNMMQLTADHRGFYDLSATGTGVNQGGVRYLTKDAVVDGNGAITHGSMDGKTPLMYNEVCQFLDHVPFDRRQMTFNNLMSAQCVTEPVKLACMTFGGWTFDDGFVVSKKFAETYKVEGADGQMRDLMIGDKISDMNGNKGVISLVVDPDMSLEEAREKGLEKEVTFFKNNPDLDVVGAPFSPPSRFNGGTAREMMQNSQDLVDLDGKVREGCMGEARLIITHMSVDEKTHMYTDDELRQGKGRRVSGQLAWALASQGAHAIMRECYGSNDGSVRNYREYLNVMGLDISETGVLHHGYKPHVNEKRQVFEMPEMRYNESNGKTRLDRRGMRNEFLQQISSEGGVMELPFPLKMPNGAELQHMNSNKTNVEYVKDEWEVAPILNEDGTIKRKGYTAHRRVNNSTRTVGDGTYGLPVLSARLRTGQSSFDDVTSTHDYTKWYSTIFDKVIDYRVAQEKGDAAGMERAQNQAQAEYDKITNDLKSRVFSGKHNFIKESIMSVRKSNSATAVWTADPRLDLDTVSMGPMMAEKMGVKDGESVLIWRDPMLRDAGFRYMKVKVDDELHGVAINPVMDKCFDGDFDGDSVGLLKLTTKEAKAEAAAKLTVAANLLDYGSLGKDGKYNLAINDGLDLKSVEYEHPELKEMYDSIRNRANELFVDENGRPRPQVDVHEREVLMKDLNGFVHSCFENGYATDALSYKDWPTHFATVEHTVASGAKGSYAKLEDYAKYCGVSYEMRSLGREEPDYMKVDDLFENPEISDEDVTAGLDEDFKALVEGQSYLLHKNPDQTECIDLTSIKDHGRSLATLEDDVAVQYATGTKSLGTGIAGMYSQRGIRALRNSCPKAVLELTYPVTQAILQVKHDPQAARRMYEIMRGPARHLWQGNKMEETMRPDGSRTWKVVREDGKPVQATPEEFVKQFVDIYTSNEGMDVSINPLYVQEVAKALTDPATGRVLDIDGSAVQKLASPMDQLAYEGDFTTACELAANERNLYSGKENGYFAPYIVVQNARNDNYNKKVGAVVRELKPLVQRDTQEKVEKSAWEDPKPKVRSTAEEMNAFFHQQREAENDGSAPTVVIVDEAVLASTPVD